jgi:hypothetical protein
VNTILRMLARNCLHKGAPIRADIKNSPRNLFAILASMDSLE